MIPASLTAPSPVEAGDNPYLSGNCAPVADEIIALDLPVTGQIPEAFEGRWLRNGPNPRPGVDPATHHWFIGDGMVHGVRLAGGRAAWYRNRWTAGPGEIGANTSVGGFAGTTWALVEAGGPPIELGYDLEPRGENRFGGTLAGPFSAHPKYDPATGELHAMGYHWPDLMDHLQYVVVGSDGRVTRTIDIPIDAMVMVHDMSLTERYAVVYDLPVTVNLGLLEQGYSFPFGWDPDRPARIGLLPRDAADASPLRWFDIDPCYIYHPLNAHDTDDGKVVLDVCRYDTMFDKDHRGPFGDSLATLHRYVVDPAAGTASCEQRSDLPMEFPRVLPAAGGRPYRFGYLAEVTMDDKLFGDTVKVDMHTGELTRHAWGPGRGGAEPVVVPRPDATAEDDAWLMVLVYDAGTDSSELAILDAADMTAPPVATVGLPRRVPHGFHGDWVPDTRVAPER